MGGGGRTHRPHTPQETALADIYPFRKSTPFTFYTYPKKIIRDYFELIIFTV